MTGTGRLTVINSVFEGLDSLAQTTTVIDTTPEQDPVQYVRQQFLSTLGRQPDPAAHFYWSDVLIKCGDNTDCLNQQRSALSEYLTKIRKRIFQSRALSIDENGNPLSGAAINLTGSQSVVTLTDSQGNVSIFAFAHERQLHCCSRQAALQLYNEQSNFCTSSRQRNCCFQRPFEPSLDRRPDHKGRRHVALAE